jgi:hypothetical protein
MADTHPMGDRMEERRVGTGTSPFLWILVLAALVVVIMWAIGAFGANEAIDDDEFAEPIGAIELSGPYRSA